MQKVIPHLWFDTQAKEAVEFYVSVFKDSKINSSQTLHDTPSGDCDILSFNLSGYSFMAISAGPLFTINPSVSFMLNFDPSKDEQAEENLVQLWNKLSEGGSALMPLDTYPFSKKYGWIQDRFGVSWQLILTNPNGEEKPFIIPSMMFTKDMSGKAQEATDFYLSVFKNSKRGIVSRYGEEAGPDLTGMINYTDFQLEGQWFTAMDGGSMHAFGFTEATSFIVKCDSGEELDYYWNKLSADPKSEQCGWLKDKYGFSWQIIPKRFDEMMSSGTPEQIDRVTQAFLPMKKIDIDVLEKAYTGN